MMRIKGLKESITSLEEDSKDKSERIIELSERLVKTTQDLEIFKSAAVLAFCGRVWFM